MVTFVWIKNNEYNLVGDSSLPSRGWTHALGQFSHTGCSARFNVLPADKQPPARMFWRYGLLPDDAYLINAKETCLIREFYDRGF